MIKKIIGFYVWHCHCVLLPVMILKIISVRDTVAENNRTNFFDDGPYLYTPNSGDSERK